MSLPDGNSSLSSRLLTVTNRSGPIAVPTITITRIRIVGPTHFSWAKVLVPIAKFSLVALHFQTPPVRSLRKMVAVGAAVADEHRNPPMNFQVNVMKPPLAAIVEAFEELADIVENNKDDLRLKPFSDACALVSVLFGSLGIAFKFAELEYNVKVHSLAEASKKLTTLHNVLDNDVERDTVKSPGSYSRNLRRVRQGLDLIRVLFEQFLLTCDCSLRNAASVAYYETCGKYHTWAIRTAVSAGMYALPSREQLLIRLNETDQTAEQRMRRYMEVVSPIINYIDKLYTSRNIILDW